MNALDFTAVWPYSLAVLTLVVLPLLISGDKPTGAVVLINWLKGVLKLEGNVVYVLVFVVSLVLAVIVALVDGAIELTGPMTPEKFSLILTIIVGGSQYWYRKLKEDILFADLEGFKRDE